MYKQFFGFKERPFQLVPNPAYLFMSQSHEEALAHLTYAVSQGDGFVEITGEVGTGKTTLCRVFLESLDNNTEAAYIFNPKLDAIQLLKAINDEFGITSEPDNTKDLIDTLNFFLMEKKKQGKNILLVIDEAQNLNRDVLEQLRLLSNLETTTSKLIQIILVGQPELGDMLDSYELRQLGQRITLSCHLRPLSFTEMKDYIRHRIHVASQKPGVKFTNRAFKLIYKYSGGVPRMINIACDRALLTAYGLNRKKITGSIAATSIRELAARGDRRRKRLNMARILIPVLSGMCLVLLTMVLYPMFKPEPGNQFRAVTSPSSSATPTAQETKEPPSVVTTNPEPPLEPASSPDPKPVAKPIATAEAVEPINPEPPAETPTNPPEPKKESLVVNAWDLEDYLKSMDTQNSKYWAMNIILNLWEPGKQVNPDLAGMEDENSFFQFVAKQSNLQIQKIEGNLENLIRLNLPAILEVYSPVTFAPVYLVLTGIDDTGLTLKAGETAEVILTNEENLDYYWHGVAHVPWRNFYNYEGTIPKDAGDDAIISLKLILREIGYDTIDMVPQYDDVTRAAVEEIQEKHGIKVDGVVGPMTKIILYNELPNLKIPHIRYLQQ